jgi:hypothetical protein
MQQSTRQEIKEITATVRQVLQDHPPTRADDNALYYHVCKHHARQIGVDLHALHFSTVFLGNPLKFPKYESVARLRRMEQRQNPDLLDPVAAANRAKKERDMVELARRGGTIPQ